MRRGLTTDSTRTSTARAATLARELQRQIKAGR